VTGYKTPRIPNLGLDEVALLASHSDTQGTFPSVSAEYGTASFLLSFCWDEKLRSSI